jgi:hypothetical protein
MKHSNIKHQVKTTINFVRMSFMRSECVGSNDRSNQIKMGFCEGCND